MHRLIALLGGLLLPAIAGAGDARLEWTGTCESCETQIAIGSCQGDAYGVDVPGDYARIPAGESRALVLRLEQGELFCFRGRHLSPAGVPGEWLFMGSKKIPLDGTQQPPVLPQPPKPSDGKVK